MNDAPRPKVDVVYHFFPHYRAPVLRKLANSRKFDFRFWGATESFEGINAFPGDASVHIHPLKMKSSGSTYFISGYSISKDTRALIVLGNPNIPQTWAIAAGAKLLGKKVAFWTHGWLRPESPLKAWIRNLYYGLADLVLVYDERSQDLAQESGFPRHKVRPIYNSLDWDAAQAHWGALSPATAASVRESFKIDADRNLLICTARLTSLCRFDLLIEAMAILKAKGRDTTLLLVGDGPERDRLHALSEERQVDVRFLGAIYDEAELSRLIYSADVTVSPGKVGLTAIHSLTYGTPVITHGDRNGQMPEVEAIEAGRTGMFFENGSATSLATAIDDYFANAQSRDAAREHCRDVIRSRYTPDVQRKLIEDAVVEMLEGKR